MSVSQSPDAVVFHYTTVEGALKIIESNNFYATDIRYLNDLSELDHFKGYVLQQLITLLDVLQPHYDKKAISHLKKFSSNVASAIVDEIEELVDIYTVSFSAPRSAVELKNGLLSQWRSYGVDGGVALEFARSDLVALVEKQKAISNQNNNYRCDMVAYGDDEKRIAELDKLFQQRLSESFEALVGRLISRRIEFRTKESLQESVSAALKEDFAIYGEILSEISKWAIFFKHQSFREECEFRISVECPFFPMTKDENVLFRMRRGIPTPYIMLFCNQEIELPIRRLIIGPNRDAKERARALFKVLDRRGRHALVEISAIPFI